MGFKLFPSHQNDPMRCPSLSGHSSATGSLAKRTIELQSAYKDDESKTLFVLEPPSAQHALALDYVRSLEHSVRQQFKIPEGEELQFWLKDGSKWLLTSPAALEGNNKYKVTWANASATLNRRYVATKGDKTNQQLGFAVFDVCGQAIWRNGKPCVDLDIGLEVGPYTAGSGKCPQEMVQISLETSPSKATILEANPQNEEQMLSITTTKSSLLTAGAGVSAIGPHPVPGVNIAYNKGRQQAMTLNSSSMWRTALVSSQQNEGKVGWDLAMKKEGCADFCITAESTHGFNKHFSAVIMPPEKPAKESRSTIEVTMMVFQRRAQIITDRNGTKIISDPSLERAWCKFKFLIEISNRAVKGGCPGMSDLGLRFYLPKTSAQQSTHISSPAG